MNYKVQSATPLEAVMVDGGQVWLRRNFTKKTEKTDEGAAYKVFEADEVSFCDPSVTEEYAKENFDALWSAHEHDGESLAEQVAAARQLAEDNAAALLELGDIIGGEQ